MPANSPARTPRWVKVSGGIAVVLIVIVAIVHLTGGSVFGHSFGRHAMPPVDARPGP